MAKAQGQQQQQNKKSDLMVTPGEVKMVGDKFEIEFEVIATDEDGKPASVSITMRKDIEKGETKTTDTATGECRFTYSVEVDKAAGKTYNLRFIRTDPVFKEVAKAIPFPEDKIAVKVDKTIDWEITSHGSNGNYFITVQITDKKNPKRKYDLWFFETLFDNMSTILPNDSNPYKDQTDDSGISLIQLKNFTELKRAIYVTIIGTTLKRTIYLGGPSQDICPICKLPFWNGVSCSNCNFPNERIIR
jgi:hypothetical protein